MVWQKALPISALVARIDPNKPIFLWLHAEIMATAKGEKMYDVPKCKDPINVALGIELLNFLSTKGTNAPYPIPIPSLTTKIMKQEKQMTQAYP